MRKKTLGLALAVLCMAATFGVGASGEALLWDIPYGVSAEEFIEQAYEATGVRLVVEESVEENFGEPMKEVVLAFPEGAALTLWETPIYKGSVRIDVEHGYQGSVLTFFSGGLMDDAMIFARRGWSAEERAKEIGMFYDKYIERIAVEYDLAPVGGAMHVQQGRLLGFAEPLVFDAPLRDGKLDQKAIEKAVANTEFFSVTTFFEGVVLRVDIGRLSSFEDLWITEYELAFLNRETMPTEQPPDTESFMQPAGDFLDYEMENAE